MTTNQPVYDFSLRMGDNTLVLGQLLSAWCGHAPALEEDIALANIGLDLIGQAKMWLSLAGEIEGEGRSADDLAFRRDNRDFHNCLLVEQSNGDYGKTLMRQFLFDAWHHPMLAALVQSSDERVAAIAEKSEKEAAYHLERSTDLVIRLGDGSQESHGRMQAALDDLWRFTGELTAPDAVDKAVADQGVAPGLAQIKTNYDAHVSASLREGMLCAPDGVEMRKGGKSGLHTEEFAFLIAEMQTLPRMYPDAQW